VLRPWGSDKEGTTIGITPVQAVAKMRVGFVGSGGNTQISSPRAVARAQPPAAPPAAAERPPLPPAAPAATREGPPVAAVPAAIAATPFAPAPAPSPPDENAQMRAALSPDAFAAGLSAIFLPRVVARLLGLYDAGGAATTWLLAEVDTLCLIVAVACAGWLTVRAATRRRRLAPLAVGTLLFGLTLAVLLALVVTNFGTLFRLRAMVLLPLALTPLAATARRPDAERRATSATAPA
jgi:hypothetical protein